MDLTVPEHVWQSVEAPPAEMAFCFMEVTLHFPDMVVRRRIGHHRSAERQSDPVRVITDRIFAQIAAIGAMGHDGLHG